MSETGDLFRRLVDVLDGVNEGLGLTSTETLAEAKSLAARLRGKVGRTPGDSVIAALMREPVPSEEAERAAFAQWEPRSLLVLAKDHKEAACEGWLARAAVSRKELREVVWTLAGCIHAIRHVLCIPERLKACGQVGEWFQTHNERATPILQRYANTILRSGNEPKPAETPP